jgi:uncharacterized protein (TIGR03792 family)
MRAGFRLSLIGCLFGIALVFTSHPDLAIAAFEDPGGGETVAVVEHLRVNVPAEGRQAWLKAEQASWEPWLADQSGFLGRDLFWDPERQEGTLLIHWASREQWKQIPESEIEAVQQRFEQLARQATGQAKGNPFPLVFEGELQPA